MTRKRCLLIGAGGWGRAWVGRFLPQASERVEVVALADLDRDVLDSAGEALGVPSERRFTDASEAIAATSADFCVIVVQPRFRQALVHAALEQCMDVLAEKPIADTWEASLGILADVRAAGRKMAVIQNYRFLPAFLTAKELLDGGRLGGLNYVTARFTAGYTPETAGGGFRHQIPGAVLYEGSVHHFDQLRNLAGADCSWISGNMWSPSWNRFATNPCGLFMAEMTNGVRCQYEVNYIAFGEQHGWHREAYRVECERGAMSIGRDGNVTITEYRTGPDSRRLHTEVVELTLAPDQGHARIIGDFVDWLDGGPPPPTGIEDNIHTAAMTFGAVAAANEGRIVDVAAMTQAATGR